MITFDVVRLRVNNGHYSTFFWRENKSKTKTREQQKEDEFEQDLRLATGNSFAKITSRAVRERLNDKQWEVIWVYCCEQSNEEGYLAIIDVMESIADILKEFV